MRLRIGCDIDGVMYAWDKTARYMLRDVLPNSPYKEVLKQESQGWDWIKDQVSREHWNWLWEEGIELGLFRYGHLYPGTIQAIREIAKRDKVILITHRPEKAVTDTLAWLGLLNLPLAGLHLLTNQEPKSWVQPQCDVYLDDKPANVVDLCVNTGGLSCMMSRPWNVNDVFHNKRVSGIEVVRSWDEFREAIEMRRRGADRLRPHERTV